MRIGLTGYAKSGKDEVADVLVQEYGFVKVNMSDALDKYLSILNPIIDHDWTYADYVEEVGFTKAKECHEVRRLLQAFGTEVGRAIDEDMWVREVAKIAEQHERVVTTGIRYRNEHVPGMLLIRVNRPGFGPLNSHSSESLDDVFALADITIENDGPLDDLQAKTRRLAEYFVHHRAVSFEPGSLARYGGFTAFDGTTPFLEGFTEGRA
jgi:hypothetical protein